MTNPTNLRVALVQLTDEQANAPVDQLTGVKVLDIYALDANAFAPQYQHGRQAAWTVEVLCAHLFAILKDNGLINEQGWQFSQYGVGDVAGFARKHEAEILSNVDQTMGLALSGALKLLSASMPRKKPIEADFPLILNRFTDIYNRLRPFMMADAERARLLGPHLPDVSTNP